MYCNIIWSLLLKICKSARLCCSQSPQKVPVRSRGGRTGLSCTAVTAASVLGLGCPGSSHLLWSEPCSGHGYSRAAQPDQTMAIVWLGIRNHGRLFVTAPGARGEQAMSVAGRERLMKKCKLHLYLKATFFPLLSTANAFHD